MLFTIPNQFPSWKAIFYNKRQVFLALWYTGWGSGLAHSSRTCSIPPDASPVWWDRHLSLVLATPAETRSGAWASQKPHRGCSSRTVLSVCLGSAQRSGFSALGQSKTLWMVWDQNVLGCRKNGQSLLSAFYEQIRTIGSKQKQWPVFPHPTPSKNQVS